MVEAEMVAQASKISMVMAGLFSVMGIGLLYLYIAISDAPDTTKVLWASALSLGVSFTFLVIWTISRDVIRQREREMFRRQVT